MNVLVKQRLLVRVTIALAGAIALYPVIGDCFLVTNSLRGLTLANICPPRDVLAPTNWLAADIMAIIAVLRWRHRLPLTFAFVAWAGFSLLPVSNIVPIAVVRADRYLYLPMAGFALWAGAALAAGEERWAGWTHGWHRLRGHAAVPDLRVGGSARRLATAQADRSAALPSADDTTAD